MTTSNCAPIIQEPTKKIVKKTLKKQAFLGTCFSIEDLLKIIREWNMLNPSDKITIDAGTDAKNIWKAIAVKLSSPKCNTEYCWVKNKLKNTKLYNELLNNFRPEMPQKWHRNNTEWLSTQDIEKVLYQYEDEFKNFTFRGAVPIDFDKTLRPNQCVSNDVCKLNIKRLYEKGKTKIGIVFNLDPHDKPGTHWVAMFIDLDKLQLGYWDSYGYNPPPEIIKLIKRMHKQSRLYFNQPFEIMKSFNRLQYKKSECGMYCIHFITQLLEGYTFKHVYNQIITDDDMNTKRHMFFSK